MPKRNTANRPTRILDAANELIALYGYDKTTVSDIAREAGVAKGAVYLHWASKEQLFDALIIREAQRVMEDFLARLEADPSGGMLARMYLHGILALKNNPLLCALYTHDSRILGNYVHAQDVQRYTNRFLFGQTFVEQMQAAGLARTDLSAQVLAYLMSVISYGFIGIETIIPASMAPSLEETGEAMAALMQSGLAGPGDNSAPGREAMQAMVAFLRQQYGETLKE